MFRRVHLLRCELVHDRYLLVIIILLLDLRKVVLLLLLAWSRLLQRMIFCMGRPERLASAKGLQRLLLLWREGAWRWHEGPWWRYEGLRVDIFEQVAVHLTDFKFWRRYLINEFR